MTMTQPQAPAQDSTTAARPNIMLIVMDDCNSYWHFKQIFGEKLQTPNLDKICAVSTAFQSAFCQVAACGPSRASFMSGMAPHQTGIFDTYRDIFELIRPDQMWSYRLKQAGYYCSSAGKVHHGYRPQPPHIHHPLYSHPVHQVRFGPRASAPFKDYGGGQMGIGTTDPEDDKHYYDHQSATDAITFLEDYNHPAPFYREVGFHNPHIPLKTPARFKEMYDHTRFMMPREWKGWRDLSAVSRSSFRPNVNLSKGEHWQKTLRNYFSAISHVDWQIGRVWDALKASPHADNTVVVITADHGYHVGDKSRFRKFSLWEEADGVPIIIHDPSRPVAQEVVDPVASLDIGPTVLDYAGLPPLSETAGQSLRPQVQGDAVEGRAVPSFFFGSAGVRQGDFRYIKYLDGGSQLIDLRSDPWQLADAPQDHPQRPQMERTLKDTTRAYGLTMIDPGETVEAPALYVSPVAGAQPPLSPPTLGIIAFDPPDMRTWDVPGNRRYYIRHHDDMVVQMPAAYRQLCYACDVGSPTHRLTVLCNDSGTHVDLVATHRRCVLEVEGGRGDDIIETLQDPLTVRLHAGTNTVRTGAGEATIHGGAGHDHVHCRAQQSWLIGGAGDLSAVLSGEASHVTTAAGQNKIVCENGAAHITIDRGQSQITLNPGTGVTLVLHRTGLPQQVVGFTGGVLDVTDWASLGPCTVTAADGDAILTCGAERVRFVATPPDVVQAALRG